MPDSRPLHGLTAQQLGELGRVLGPFAARIDRVGLFGSRATGTARPWSDVDLVLFGDVPQAVVDRLWTLFDASHLALEVDVLAYKLIGSSALKAHVDAVGQTLFSGEALRNLAGRDLRFADERADE